MNKLNFLLSFILSTFALQAQNTLDEKDIIANNTNYFQLERENIHVHFDKTVFTVGETIWFKGYVIDKKTGLPNIKSSNILMEVFNSKGEKLEVKLLFAENSTFYGYYKTDKIFDSGNYYFRFFTNYMNNFSEDESANYEITILQPDKDNSAFFPTFDSDNYGITYYPESGTLLENTENNIVVEIKDCNGLGGKLSDIEILGTNNEVVGTFSTNEQGFGKVKLLNTKNINYTIKAKSNEKTTTKIIEKPKKTGYILNVFDSFNSDNVIVEIKTNTTTAALQENLYLATQSLDNVSIVKVNLETNSPVKKLAFLKKDLAIGMTNFVLLNSQKVMQAERLYYNSFSIPDYNITLTDKVIKRDSIHFKFKSNFKLGEFSYSIVPNQSIAKGNKYNIHSSLLLNNDITNPISNTDYYFQGFNRLKHYELDLALHCTKYKYSLLNNISIPKENFKVENGLTLIGKVNSDKILKDHNVNLVCIGTGVNLNAAVNEKNEFQFQNLIVSDSTAVFLTLVNAKNEIKELKAAFNLIKAKNQFYKPIQLKQYCFENTLTPKNKANIKYPKFAKNIQVLDSIQITKTGPKKPKLTERSGGGYLSSFVDGYKVDNDFINKYPDVLSFIQSKGFDITVEGGNVTVVSRVTRSFSGSREPTILIDNAPIIDVNILYGLKMNDIDEIYINKRGYGAGSAGRGGVISIFPKKTATFNKNSKTNTRNYLCKNGFTAFLPFKNDFWIDFQNESFVNFGTVFWNPRVTSDANGDFEIVIPTTKVGDMLIHVNGINSSGQLLTKTISVSP